MELFREIKRVLRPGGHYLIIQHFYKSDEQMYGREVMQTPEDLMAMLPFKIVYFVESERWHNYKIAALVENSV